MLGNRKPKFRFREVLIQVDANQIKLSSQETEKEVLGIVLYVGDDCEKYKIGDEVLFSKQQAAEMKFFGAGVWKVPVEHLIICGFE